MAWQRSHDMTDFANTARRLDTETLRDLARHWRAIAGPACVEIAAIWGILDARATATYGGKA